MRRAATHTPGGARLRSLRERAGKTQLSVEGEAGLGAGYLQRVESGRVAQPARATLERILAALGARFGEQHEVLELFGYGVALPLPNDAERDWARHTARLDLESAPFPAYVLDCATRLVAWNSYVPCLFGVANGDPLFTRLARRVLVAEWFDESSPLAALIAEPESFLPALVRALRYELQLFQAEPWCAQMLGELWRDSASFRRCWDAVAHEPEIAGAARPLVPMRIVAAGGRPLSFRLSSERFARDPRFRLIFFLPADPHTMRRCAAWAAAGA
jgi:transcriptional regulator with XRE-family HTH domain